MFLFYQSYIAEQEQNKAAGVHNIGANRAASTFAPYFLIAG